MPTSNDLSVPPSKLSPKDEEAVFRLRLAKEKEASEFGRRLAKEKSGKFRMSSLGGEKDYPALPFLDRMILSRMDKKEEAVAFAEKKYGKGSVSFDQRGMVVTVGNKKMRAAGGGLAGFAAEAPEMILGGAGAAAGGATGGPVGAIAGGAAGAMAGKSVVEAAKSAAGLQRKAPGEIVKSVERAGEGGAIGTAVAPIAGRVIRGPLPQWFAGTTPETKALTKSFLAGGGKPPLGSALPSAKFLQREIKKAEILTGKDTGTTRKNVEFLQKRAHDILDKADVPTGVGDKVTANMLGNESALSYTEAGRDVQRNAGMMMTQIKNKVMTVDRKTREYLEVLAAPGRTPEDAMSWLIEGGQRDRLERFVKVMGKNSVVVQSVQHQALKQVLADSLSRTERDGGEALYNALKVFTSAQKKLLFPNGADKDLLELAKQMKFAFPHPQEMGMPGWTTGSQFEKKFYERWYHQGISAITRALLQHPRLIRRLAVGYRGGRAQAEAARASMIAMFQESSLGNQVEEQPAATQR